MKIYARKRTVFCPVFIHNLTLKISTRKADSILCFLTTSFSLFFVLFLPLPLALLSVRAWGRRTLHNGPPSASMQGCEASVEGEESLTSFTSTNCPNNTTGFDLDRRPLRKLEKAVAVRNSLLEKFSGKFRRCWKIPHRFSGSAKCYPCQGLGTFRQGKRLLENWPRLRERCWTFSSETATAFLSSSDPQHLCDNAVAPRHPYPGRICRLFVGMSGARKDQLHIARGCSGTPSHPRKP